MASTVPSEQHYLLESARRALSAGGVDRRSHILVAFSGGPDSTALLALLAGPLRSAFSRLTAAYFRHGLQEEAAQKAEETTVTETCLRLGVSLEVDGLDEGVLSASPAASERGIEAAAREARYDFFARIALLLGVTHLVTAHHLDDQVETILMRLLTKGGLGSLAGIDDQRLLSLPDGQSLRVVRPLLEVPRQDVRAFAESLDLARHEDAGNEGERFLRNRIRHRLRPLLHELVPYHAKSLLSLGREARDLGSIVRGLAEELPVEIQGREIRFPGAVFWQAAPAVRREAVLSAVNRVIPGTERLPDRFLRPLWGNKAEGRLFGHGVEVVYGAGAIWIRPLVVRPDKKGYFSVVWESMLPSPVRLRLLVSGASAATTDIECDGVVPPLVLRTRRSGDRLDRSDGSIRVNRLLSKEHVPTEQRDIIPILEDREGILAVVSTGKAREIRLSERCHTVEADRKIPNIIINVSENGIKVEYARRQ